MQSHQHPGRTMARAWLLATLVFMLVCGYVVAAGRELTYLDKTGPGPGFFPVWVGGLGLLAGAGLLWAIASGQVRTEHAWSSPARRDALRIALTVVAVALAGAALEFLGFRLTIFLFTAGVFHLYGMRIGPALAGAAACALAVYFLFNGLLKVLLPVGVLGF